MIDYVVITILSIGAVIVNLIAGLRALRLAQKLENKRWGCGSLRACDATKVLLGFFIACGVLSGMKAWSIGDIFTNYWDNMPETYHIRAFGYLAENYMVAMLAWIVTNFVKRVSECRGKKNETG